MAFWGWISGRYPQPASQELNSGSSDRRLDQVREGTSFHVQRLSTSGLALELFWILSSDLKSEAKLAVVGDSSGQYQLLSGFHLPPGHDLPAMASQEAISALLHKLGAAEATQADTLRLPCLSEERLAELHDLLSPPIRQQPEASLVGQLAESAVGFFFLALAKLAHLNFAQNVPCPALVVFGLEAIGKSSFMRALTKCHFSPSGKGLTTRAPVRLCLVSIPRGSAPSFEVSFRRQTYPQELESDIASKVAEIMKVEIPGGTLTQDEITVTIRKPDIPNLVFIDLPGIRETDPISKQLAIKYLKDPNNLVICLVEAHFNSLTAHSGVDLVRTHGKVENTCLVLTRSDEVLAMGSEAIQDRLLDRTFGRSEEMAAIGVGSVHFVFGDCPRRPSQMILDDFEAEQYEQHILQGLPEAERAFIRQHCTMTQLMTSLVPWFESFLRRNGVPLALRWLEPKLQEALQRITDLGPPVEHLSMQEVMDAVLSCCDFQSVYNKLYREYDDLPGLSICLSPAQDGQLSMAKWRSAQQQQPPAAAYWHQQAAVTAAAAQGIREWLMANHHLPLLDDMLQKAFATRSVLRLDRFQGLLKAILDGRLAHVIDLCVVRERILGLPAIQQLKCGLPALSQPGVLAAIDADVRAAFIHLAVLPLDKHDGPLVHCMVEDTGLKLEESAHHQEQRQQAEKDQQAVEEAMQIMKSIQSTETAAHAGPSVPEGRPDIQEAQEPAHSSSISCDRGEEAPTRSGLGDGNLPDPVKLEHGLHDEGPEDMDEDESDSMDEALDDQLQPPDLDPGSGIIDISSEDDEESQPRSGTAGQTGSGNQQNSRLQAGQPVASVSTPGPVAHGLEAVSIGKRPLQDLHGQKPSSKKVRTGNNNIAMAPSRSGKQAAIAESGRTVRGRVKQQASTKVKLVKIGKLRVAKGWFDAGCIFPDGYKALVWYKSSKDLSQRVQHECSIFQAGAADECPPTFQVIADDCPDEPLMASSCSGCWEKVLQRLNDARIRAGQSTVKTKIPGPEYFGLHDPQVQAAYEDLDGSRRCKLYWKGVEERAQEAAKRHGGTHAVPAPTTVPAQPSTDQVHRSTIRRLFAPSSHLAERGEILAA
ncbi:hypothetical protein WJX74_009982 [Apatococcus lobatus]|uniref:Dynamin N-terminal domain-containing protein n=1 Tax=Apatococcus lobatus TaxID=904363 RepID=A0AAW1RBY1_9CHLO